MTMVSTQNEHVKKLEWAIEFSRRDLKTLTKDEWMEVRSGLYDFIQYTQEKRMLGGPLPPANLTPKGPAVMTTDKSISRLQERLRCDLLRLSYDEDKEERRLPPVVAADDFILINKATISAYGLRPDQPFEWRIRWASPVNLYAVVTISLFRHLISSQILLNQFRMCPVCHRVFILKRKPRLDCEFHCSLRCSRNAATRRYRAKNREKWLSDERERSHKRYAKKTRKGKTKIGRKPHKNQTTGSSASDVGFVTGSLVTIDNHGTMWPSDPGKVGPWKKRRRKM